ncbi:MAG: ABC transporter substrate-binding protein [Eubacteriaceae bacterium]
MKKRNLIIIYCFIFLLFNACSLNNSNDGLSQIIDENTFIDDSGKKSVVEVPYEKIICLYSAHTENLFALGVGDKIIGVNNTSIYPPAAAFLPRYDYKADPEPLIAAQPDIVIIRPFVERNYPDYIKAIKNAGINVVSLYPSTNEDFEKYIKILAMLTGSEAKAEEELAKLEQRIVNIEEKICNVKDKLTVYFESTKTNYRTITIDSNPARAIVSAGGINIADDVTPIEKGSTIAEYGIEKLMINAENIDVYVSQRGAMNSGGSMISIPQREGFTSIKAVREGRILEINEKIISSPTFRYYKGVKEIARMLYPEIMDDYSVYESDEPLTREIYSIITVMFDHAPIFVPSSSHYYESEYYNHTYGLFEDVAWDYEYFDYIETAVTNSFIKGYKKDDGTEYFDKVGYVNRENLAFTLYIMGEFNTMENHEVISDINQCSNATIVQKIVDNGIMKVDENDNFNPKKIVSANEAIEVFERLKLYEK